MLTQSVSQLAHDFPVKGAYVSLDVLVQAQFASKLIASKRKRSQSSMQGASRSHYKSRGLEFEEVRHYQAGDDIRTIDWRVTARSGKPHTKLFREEREHDVFLCVDQRLSNFFGSRVCFKSASIAYYASLLGWVALDHNDRIGGVIFDDKNTQQLRPSNRKKSFLYFLNQLAQTNQALNTQSGLSRSPNDSINQALEHTQAANKHGATIYVISDFQSINQHSIQILGNIAKHNRLNCIQVFDPLELDMPKMKHARFSNGKGFLSVNTQQSEFQNFYHQRQSKFQQQLPELLKKMGVHLFQFSTHESPVLQLSQEFAMRS